MNIIYFICFILSILLIIDIRKKWIKLNQQQIEYKRGKEE